MKKKTNKQKRSEWIYNLMSEDFIEIHPRNGWKPKYRLFINATIAGHSIVVEPEHPAFKSWADIRKHIDKQLK